MNTSQARKKPRSFRDVVRFAWKIQPRSLRMWELRFLEFALTKPASANRNPARGDTVVCGLLGTASGLGESARLLLRRFRESGYDVKSANFSPFAVLEDFDGGPVWPADASPGGTVVICINPDILHLVFIALRRYRLENRRIIGAWHCELETFPPQWRRALDYVDEVWIGSSFAANGLRRVANGKPVHVVPPPLDLDQVPIQPRQDPWPSLAGYTVAFFMYDVRSIHARKNPEAVIEAFRRAAADRSDAVLVIKVNNSVEWPEAITRLERASVGLSNIHIMQDKVTPDVMRDIMARVDIVISLHRAEGFGLLMAEAMAAGKPVIATGWSGNVDFMTPECSVLIDYKLVPIEDPQDIYNRYGREWADPDIGQAAAALRRLLDDPMERQRMGQAAREHVMKSFSREAWFRRIPDSFWNMQEKKGGLHGAP